MIKLPGRLLELGTLVKETAVSAAAAAYDTASTVPEIVKAVGATVNELVGRLPQLREFVRVSEGMVAKLENIRGLIKRVQEASGSPTKTIDGLTELKASVVAAKTPGPEEISVRALNALLDITESLITRALGYGGPTLVSFTMIVVSPHLTILDQVLAGALGVIDAAELVQKPDQPANS